MAARTGNVAMIALSMVLVCGACRSPSEGRALRGESGESATAPAPQLELYDSFSPARCGGSPASAILAADGAVAACDEQLVSSPPHGEQGWTRPVPGGIATPPFLVAAAVWTVEAGSLVRTDPASGADRSVVDDIIWAAPAGADRIVAGAVRRLVVVRASTGEVEREVAVPSGIDSAGANIVSSADAVALVSSGSVTTFDPGSGELATPRPLEPTEHLLAWPSSTWVVVATDSEEWTAIHADASTSGRGAPLVAVGSSLVVMSTGGMLEGIDLLTGASVWRRRLLVGEVVAADPLRTGELWLVGAGASTRVDVIDGADRASLSAAVAGKGRAELLAVGPGVVIARERMSGTIEFWAPARADQ